MHACALVIVECALPVPPSLNHIEKAFWEANVYEEWAPSVMRVSQSLTAPNVGSGPSLWPCTWDFGRSRT